MCANYDNTPMQYTAILHRFKKGINFQMKKIVIFFLIFAQIRDRGYRLEHGGSSNEYP